MLEVSKKSLPSSPAPVGQSARVWFQAKSNHFQSLMARNFKALWTTDFKFAAFKDQVQFKSLSKFQEASSILRMGFALSKWPYFQRVYLVRMSFLTRIAVFWHFQKSYFQTLLPWITSKSVWLNNHGFMRNVYLPRSSFKMLLLTNNDLTSA